MHAHKLVSKAQSVYEAVSLHIDENFPMSRARFTSMEKKDKNVCLKKVCRLTAGIFDIFQRPKRPITT